MFLEENAGSISAGEAKKQQIDQCPTPEYAKGPQIASVLEIYADLAQQAAAVPPKQCQVTTPAAPEIWVEHILTSGQPGEPGGDVKTLVCWRCRSFHATQPAKEPAARLPLRVFVLDGKTLEVKTPRSRFIVPCHPIARDGSMSLVHSVSGADK